MHELFIVYGQDGGSPSFTLPPNRADLSLKLVILSVSWSSRYFPMKNPDRGTANQTKRGVIPNMAILLLFLRFPLSSMVPVEIYECCSQRWKSNTHQVPTKELANRHIN